MQIDQRIMVTEERLAVLQLEMDMLKGKLEEWLQEKHRLAMRATSVAYSSSSSQSEEGDEDDSSASGYNDDD
jgi:regulator of replication initiation timing